MWRSQSRMEAHGFEKRQSSSSKQQSPVTISRYGHFCFIFKETLYLYGGFDSRSTQSHAINPLMIYRYNLHESRVDHSSSKNLSSHQDVTLKYSELLESQGKENCWKKVQTNANWQTAQKQLKESLAFQGHQVDVEEKRLYVFGGSNKRGECTQYFLRLSLETFEWVKCEQKGKVPEAQQKCHMKVIEKSDKKYLVLLGGLDRRIQRFYNRLYVYQFESKTWVTNCVISDTLIPPRLNPSVLVSEKEDKFYIFGGYSVNIREQGNYMNDFFEISFSLDTSKNLILTSRIKNLFNEQRKKYWPEGRICSHLFQVTSETGEIALALISGQGRKLQSRSQFSHHHQNEPKKSKFWLWSIRDGHWIEAETIYEVNALQRCHSSLANDTSGRSAYIIGGYQNEKLPKNITIELFWKESLASGFSKEQNVSAYESRVCFGSSILTELVESIKFPFAAFGLIFDNFTNFGAEIYNTKYRITKQPHQTSGNKEPYFLIESDVTFGMHQEQFLQQLKCLQGGIRSYISCDKRIKAQFSNQAKYKQILTNIALGGFRLGAEIAWIEFDKTQDKIRVVILRREVKVVSSDKMSQKGVLPPLDPSENGEFYAYYFSISTQEIFQKQVTELKGELKQNSVRKLLLSNNRYKRFINAGISIIKKGLIKNVLFIMSLRDTNLDYVIRDGSESTQMDCFECDYELYPSLSNNDIFYGDWAIISRLAAQDVPIHESIDVSLKSYISGLYIQNCQHFSISVQGLEAQSISPHECLNKVDQLKKNNEVVEMAELEDFDFKFSEVYFNFDLSRKMDFFANGVLIYHKNRFIKRLGDIEMGMLLEHAEIMESRNRRLYKKVHMSEGKDYSPLHNFLKTFGNFQIQENIAVNITKTDFVQPLLLQKIEQTYKLEEEFIERLLKIKQPQEIQKIIANKDSRNYRVKSYDSELRTKEPKKKNQSQRQNREKVEAQIGLTDKDVKDNRLGEKQRKQNQEQHQVQIVDFVERENNVMNKKIEIQNIQGRSVSQNSNKQIVDNQKFNPQESSFQNSLHEPLSLEILPLEVEKRCKYSKENHQKSLNNQKSELEERSVNELQNMSQHQSYQSHKNKKLPEPTNKKQALQFLNPVSKEEKHLQRFSFKVHQQETF